MTGIQITVDSGSPSALAAFWAEVLGYVDQPPPDGFDTWEAALDAFGIDRSDPDQAHALVDPSCVGPRMLFVKVPEQKSAKNRFHLDVLVPAAHADGVEPDRCLTVLEARADELVALGAERVGSFAEPTGTWVTLRDPEGNEFCLH